MTPREKALKIDPHCLCKIEQEPGKIAFAVVRNAAGRMIGRHRTTKVAWESALELLEGKRPKNFYKHAATYERAPA